MTKVYDPQYSTQVKFNTPILLAMVNERNLVKLNHWLNNAEPHKKMATSAFETCLVMNWIEGLEAIVSSEWVKLKSLISTGWNHIVTRSNHQNLKGDTESEKWLYQKTFNENNFTKNELNNLTIDILDLAQYYRASYYWTVFFKHGVILKGKKAESLFNSLLYFRYHNEREKHNQSLRGGFPSNFYSDEEVAIRQSYIDDALSVSVQISLFSIVNILVEEKMELFDKIMNADVIIDPKDLAILAAMIAIYYRSFKVQILKIDESVIEQELEKILKSLIRFGLTEKVIFKKKDIEKDYSGFFERNNGYISLNNVITSFKYHGICFTALQIPRIEYELNYFAENKIVDVEIFTGDLYFAKPNHKADYNKKSYGPLTEKEKKECRRLMAESIIKYKNK